MRRLRRIATAFVAASILPACGGGGGTTARGSIPGPAVSATATTPSLPAASGAFQDGTASLGGATPLGPAHFARLALVVALKPRDATGLAAYARMVNTPGSAVYRQFLTPQEIGDRFGASQADERAAVAYFAGAGLHVSGWPQRLMLKVDGSQSALETAFHTKFGRYRTPVGTVTAPMGGSSVPASLAVTGSPDMLRGVTHTSTTFVRASGVSNGLTSGYSPQQIASAFDYRGAYADGFTGAGVDVGIIGTAGISTSSGGRVGDVEYYKRVFGIGGASAVTVVTATDADLAGNAATGFSTPPPLTPTTKDCSGYVDAEFPTPTCNPEDAEVQIDTEQIASLAYDSPIQFFLAYNANDGCVDASGKPVAGSPCPTTGTPGDPGGPGVAEQGLPEIDEELQSAIAANTSDVLSISAAGPEAGEVDNGLGDLNADGTGIEPTAFAALAAEGTAVFVATGDTGAGDCGNSGGGGVCADYPATDPNVVAVGGVSAPLDGSGAFVGPLQAWGISTTAGFSGGTGGFSTVFVPTSFQSGAAGVTGSYRNVPDASLDADPGTGVALVTNADPSLGGPAIGGVGGTSVAAPQMAAMWALVLSACKVTPSCATAKSGPAYRLGNPNAFFYPIYEGTNALPYASVFADVLYGDNAEAPRCVIRGVACPTGAPQLDPGYLAGSGYDRATGIGVPFARNLIRAVVGI